MFGCSGREKVENWKMDGCSGFERKIKKWLTFLRDYSYTPRRNILTKKVANILKN